MIAVTPREDWEWCCAADALLPAKERTIWMLRDLKERDRVELEDAVMVRRDENTGAISSGMGTRVYLTVRAGLAGLGKGSKFPDADGKPIKFATDAEGRVTDDFLDRVEWGVQTEMFIAITARLTMTEDEKEE